mmetsp:Transcript_5527/g.13654  ORF Transcript_5527/g.13654 Transcript_5527/m.13654 type:complete len:267 (-) Transcript_5527:400-1200(-)
MAGPGRDAGRRLRTTLGSARHRQTTIGQRSTLRRQADTTADGEPLESIQVGPDAGFPGKCQGPCVVPGRDPGKSRFGPVPRGDLALPGSRLLQLFRGPPRAALGAGRSGVLARVVLHASGFSQRETPKRTKSDTTCKTRTTRTTRTDSPGRGRERRPPGMAPVHGRVHLVYLEHHQFALRQQRNVHDHPHPRHDDRGDSAVGTLPAFRFVETHYSRGQRSSGNHPGRIRRPFQSRDLAPRTKQPRGQFVHRFGRIHGSENFGPWKQ